MKSHGLDLSLNLITNISSFECQSSQRRIQIRHIDPLPFFWKVYCWLFYILSEKHAYTLIYSNLTIRHAEYVKNSRPQEFPVLKFLEPPLALPLFFTLQYTWREQLKQGSCDRFNLLLGLFEYCKVFNWFRKLFIEPTTSTFILPVKNCKM